MEPRWYPSRMTPERPEGPDEPVVPAAKADDEEDPVAPEIGDGPTQPISITELLQQWKGGDPNAHEVLLENVYPSLQRIARNRLRNEKVRALSTGELVHEAYLKLVETKDLDWERRGQFFGIASRVMRRILVEQARARQVRERKSVLLREPEAAEDGHYVDVLAVEAALQKLEAEGHELESQVVQLRFFGGLSIAEVAEQLGVGHATVERAWASARERLGRMLG